MNLTDAQAVELLNTLLARRGVLRIITSEVLPEFRRKADDPRSPAKATVDLRDPSVMVLHDVVRIEPHEVRTSHLVAYSDEGDYVESYDGPKALLGRLLNWRYFDPTAPATTEGRVAVAAETMYDALHESSARG